jgi:UDP-3-O-[3-hydroxymyristoyl] glucosamine N-acyltransferase
VIGDDTLVYPQVSIYHGSTIGARCIIHSGAVIGADGFGFAPDFGADGGSWLKIPQTGTVMIGEAVEIGANTTIDRGAMADTVIEQGCKLDNQIQIAHNVHIGAFTVIAGRAAIAGSTKIGRYCIIGGAANLAGHLTIADKVTISGGTSITKSIQQAGQFTSVFPFMPHHEWEKNAAVIRQLHKMRMRVRQLERELGKTVPVQQADQDSTIQ